MRRAGPFLLAACLALLAAPASAQPSDENKAAARALATQGAEAIRAGHYAEAIDLVRRAESILHAPTHLLLIARAQVGAGKLVAARETYLRLEREEIAPSAPAAFRNAQTAGKAELEAIEPKIASLRLSVEGLADKKATLTLDDAPVPGALLGVFRPMDPGTHTVVVTPASGSPITTTIELKDGEKKDVALAVPDAAVASVPADPGAQLVADGTSSTTNGTTNGTTSRGFFTPLRIGGVALSAVGVIVAVTGAVFVAKGFSTASTANTNAMTLCSSGGSVCPNTEQVQTQVIANDDLAAKDKNIGVGLLVGGAAAIGGGVALLVVGKPTAPPVGAGQSPTRWASIEPFFAGAGGGLRGFF